MADTKIVAASLQVDSGNSNANIKEVNKNVADLKGNLTATGATLKDTSKGIESTGGAFSKLKEKMEGLPGPLSAAGEGVNKLGTAFKALLANPVVLVIAAIVAGLALLYKAFTNTFEGGEKMEQVFAGIKAAGQALLDSLGHIAQAAVDLFHFDFSGAVSEIKAVGDAAVNAYGKMAALTKEAQQLARDQATNDLDQAKREQRLAKLKADAYDDSIPVAKRKALLKELQADSEQNAKEDIALAKKIADNKIAQLTLEKDGYKKNFVEIQKIKADQVKVETENADELFQIGRQITRADKEEISQRKEAAAKAREEAKAARQNYIDFVTKLKKLQQENDIALTRNAYEKEKKALENKIANEKEEELQAFKDKKITKEQYNELITQIDIGAQNERDQLTAKHNDEVAKKEEAFQKQLNEIRGKTKLDGIKDARELESVQLKITYEQNLKDAAQLYKDDAVKFQAIKNALDDQLRAAQEKLDEKNRKEDAKKKFDLDVAHQKTIIESQKHDFQDKLDAVAKEQALVKKAFDDKLITELDYNAKVEELAQKRIQIGQMETDFKKAQASEVANTLNALADLVGKQTIAGKALAIATALINTYQGASEAIKQKSTLPSPFDVIAKVANVAAVIGMGLKTVKEITAVKVPGGSGGGASVSAPSITPSAPIAPVQGSTKLDANSLNKIGNATNRAYVLDSDVANHRERDIRLNRAARLG
jgi:hypothetical protein